MKKQLRKFLRSSEKILGIEYIELIKTLRKDTGLIKIIQKDAGLLIKRIKKDTGLIKIIRKYAGILEIFKKDSGLLNV